ncbi:hypothetical protein AVEN_241086-1 [Araneus ventricosus]|uniref:Uncharacterized protein n=1 Tax=Araneus ventricosus TaxID=182803 RepID=A0A4Y2LN98_ARAVE|nr:hypothetical protein AVEN_241086-1 [Araneus ventricosus]
MKKFKYEKTLLLTKFVNSADYDSGAIFSSNDLRTDVSDPYKACYLTREAIRPLQWERGTVFEGHTVGHGGHLPWVTATCHRNHSYQEKIPQILLVGYDSAYPRPLKGMLQVLEIRVQVRKFSNASSKS